MSNADDLLDLLKEEEALLRARRFAELDGLMARKVELASAVKDTADVEALEAIQQQAQENERLLGLALKAIRGVRARFADITEAHGAVGYGPDGERLSFGDEKGNRLA